MPRLVTLRIIATLVEPLPTGTYRPRIEFLSQPVTLSGETDLVVAMERAAAHSEAGLGPALTHTFAELVNADGDAEGLDDESQAAEGEEPEDGSIDVILLASHIGFVVTLDELILRLRLGLPDGSSDEVGQHALLAYLPQLVAFADQILPTSGIVRTQLDVIKLGVATE